MFFLFPAFLQTLLWIPARIILFLFLGLSVRGSEYLKNLRRPVIFAVNHTSEWDPILVPAALRFLSPLMPMFYTSRERKFYKKRGIQALFYGGLFFKLWGAYPVNIGVKNYTKSLKHHLRILFGKKGSLCIFPEGTKTKNSQLQPFKGGVAFLLHRTKAPVVPVNISGMFGMRKSDFFLRKRKAIVTFGAPIYAEELFKERHYTPEQYKSIAKEIRERALKLSPENHYSMAGVQTAAIIKQ